ncbi:hypothetical protein B0H11DRAFT_2268691 [Mycena galericulata]|nr:hypothetical protein B0H11DRAFT_2268691 [Mycena galericulata]
MASRAPGKVIAHLRAAKRAQNHSGQRHVYASPPPPPPPQSLRTAQTEIKSTNDSPPASSAANALTSTSIFAPPGELVRWCAGEGQLSATASTCTQSLPTPASSSSSTSPPPPCPRAPPRAPSPMMRRSTGDACRRGGARVETDRREDEVDAELKAPAPISPEADRRTGSWAPPAASDRHRDPLEAAAGPHGRPADTSSPRYRAYRRVLLDMWISEIHEGKLHDAGDARNTHGRHEPATTHSMIDVAAPRAVLAAQVQDLRYILVTPIGPRFPRRQPQPRRRPAGNPDITLGLSSYKVRLRDSRYEATLAGLTARDPCSSVLSTLIALISLVKIVFIWRDPSGCDLGPRHAAQPTPPVVGNCYLLLPLPPYTTRPHLTDDLWALAHGWTRLVTTPTVLYLR